MTRALVLHGVTTGSSSQRTRAATAGPDVVVTNVPARFLPELTAREHDPGVTGHSGPYPVASAVMRAGRHAAAVIAEGRDQAPAPAGQPKVTQGTWVRPGDVVLERDFADAPGIGAGASVTLNGRPFQVAGVAVTAAFPPYPETGFMPHPTRASPELIWLTQADARSPATTALPLSSVQRAKSAPVLGDCAVTTPMQFLRQERSSR